VIAIADTFKVETSYLIVLKFGTQKGDVRAHLGTKEYDKHLQSHLQNNNNFLSCPQGKPLMARS